MKGKLLWLSVHYLNFRLECAYSKESPQATAARVCVTGECDHLWHKVGQESVPTVGSVPSPIYTCTHIPSVGTCRVYTQKGFSDMSMKCSIDGAPHRRKGKEMITTGAHFPRNGCEGQGCPTRWIHRTQKERGPMRTYKVLQFHSLIFQMETWRLSG